MSGGDTLRLAGIVRESIVDGPGIRFTVFCQGCPHGCRGCHNPETHDFAGGRDVSTARIVEEIEKDPLLAGVTFSGGEPFCQAESLANLACEVRKRGLSVTVFTGYTYEELERMSEDDAGAAELLALTDILIDGPYVEEMRDLTLRFRGSSNQRVIDMDETRRTGSVCLWDE